MTTAQKIIQWSNIALVLGGLLEILTSYQFLSGGALITAALAGLALLIFGLAGLHARQAKKMGWFGMVGIVLLMIGSVLTLLPLVTGNSLLSNSLFASTGAQRMAYLLFETGLVAQVGYFLYGLASLRVKVLPQQVNYLLIISVVLMIIAGNFGQGLGLAAIGVILWRSKNSPAQA